MRLEPRWRRAEPHRGKQIDHLSNRKITKRVDYSASIRPGRASIHAVPERLARNRALAAPTRAHDQPDLPILVRPRHIHFKPLHGILRRRQPKHPSHLLHAKRIANRTGNSSANSWHSTYSVKFRIAD